MTQRAETSDLGGSTRRFSVRRERVRSTGDTDPEIEFDWDIGEDGAGRFVFHTDRQRRWQIPKFLDDDYLQSLVTEFVSEANSKHQMR